MKSIVTQLVTSELQFTILVLSISSVHTQISLTSLPHIVMHGFSVQFKC